MTDATPAPARRRFLLQPPEQALREIHIGRLIDHVHLRARDFAAAKRFYRRSAESVVIRANLP